MRRRSMIDLSSTSPISSPNDSSSASPTFETQINITKDILNKIRIIYTEKSTLNQTSPFFITFLFFFLSILNLITASEFENDMIKILLINRLKFIWSIYLLLLGSKFFIIKKSKKFSNYIILSIVFFFTLCSPWMMSKFYFNDNISDLFECSKYDLCALLLILTIIYLRFNFSFKNLILHFLFISFYMIFSISIYISNGIIQSLKDLRIFGLVFLFILIIAHIINWRNFFLKNEIEEKKISIEKEIAKINLEYESVQNKLETNYQQISPIGLSKADELLMKLKYLKFQSLVGFKNAQTDNQEVKMTKLATSASIGNEFMKKKNIEKKNEKNVDNDVLVQKVDAYNLVKMAKKNEKNKKIFKQIIYLLKKNN